MKKPKFQAPTGTRDIFSEQQLYFQKIYKAVENVADFYRFGKIDTPIFENAELFSRGVGIGSEIVAKQMYAFRAAGGDFLALRPEGTAPVVRAYIERGMSNLPQPIKFWYFGPFFRHEKPQAGRFRQFHQFGFEVLGESGPIIDAQIIQIFYGVLTELKFKNLTVEINSIGDSQCRPYYKKSLASYFRYRESQLCSDCRRRLRENPLRILDCKEEKCQPIKAGAPQMVDHLCEVCHNHFKKVLEFLDELGLPYELNPYLVRGLDYYTKTVFEILEKTGGDGKQGSLVGGGRYDGLAKILGGKDTSACGGAAGIERVISFMKGGGLKAGFGSAKPKVFLAQLGDSAKRKSLVLLEEFRKAKIPVAESLGRDSLRVQLGRANKLGADYCLILGQKEILDGTVIIRDMGTGKQEIVKFDKAVAEIKKRLKY